TAAGTDDDGAPVEGSDDATVTLIPVVPAITVVKTANPVEVAEPGALVDFAVQVTNDSVAGDPVTITSLVDSIHGDLNGLGTCAVPFTLQSGETYSCTFSATVSGNAGYSETDVVTAAGTDDDGAPVEGSDDATVTLTPVAPAITVVKTADPVEVPEPGATVDFAVQVTNDSVAGDPVTITSLVDSIHGDLNGLGACAVPFTLQPGETYSCAFAALVPGNAGYSETDTVTASGTDDEGTEVEGSDDATVDVVSSAIRVTKTRTTASPVLVGEVVQFELVITNLGDTVLQSVALSDLYETAYLRYTGAQPDDGHLEWSQLGPLAPGAAITVTVEFAALASTQELQGGETINSATGTAVDGLGNERTDTDSDTVSIYVPEVGIAKRAEDAVVTINEPFTYTILVTNAGDYDLNPVVVTDTLPEGMSYVDGSAVPAPTMVAGQQLVWVDLTSGVPLAPGEQVEITFQAYVAGQTGIYQNVAVVEATHPRGVVTDTTPGPIQVEDPRLAIDKEVAAPGNAVMGIVSFTVEIRNLGSSILDVVPMTDQWIGPVQYVGGAPTPGVEDNAARSIRWDDLTAPAPYGFGRNLAPGEAFTVNMMFQLTSYMEMFSMRNDAVVEGALDIYGNLANRDEDHVIVFNMPTPIEIMDFRASLDSEGVLLEWETFQEDRYTLGFTVLRSDTGDLEDAQELGLVPATSLGTGVTSYSFRDSQVEPGTTYTYWLRVEYTEQELQSALHKDTATITVPQTNLPYRIYLPVVVRNLD
ncbi:MAG TPA: hypothetical protein VM366_16130, partial [Anaerolineae bacterium]|nr:hypothetical protein [Anaerolineae bacterium]